MKSAEDSSKTTRSPRKSQRRKVGELDAGEAPLRKIRSPRKLPVSEIIPKADGEGKEEGNSASESASKREESIGATKRGVHRNPKEETVETRVSTNKAANRSKPRKHGSEKVVEKAPETNGDTQLKPKRKTHTKAEEADAEATESTPKRTKRKVSELEEEEEVDKKTSQPKTKRKTRTKKEETVLDEKASTTTLQKTNKIKQEESAQDSEGATTKTKRKSKVKVEEEELDENGESVKKTKRKRKTKEEKEAEAMPLAARSNGLRMFIGAHVSSAKGVHNSVTNCVHIGGNAFAMFLKSQRKWENPPLQDEHKNLFISSCTDHKYDASSHVLPHGSYLVNLAQEETEKADQAYNAFLDDLHRCDALGIKLYNFHPGSTGTHPRPSAIARIAKALNRAHLATKNVIPVLEAMAGGGNVIGSTFEDLRDIIALTDDKTRIGVCIDTCHVFAAGYDLRTPTAFKKTLNDFDNVVGMKYLRALHLNDSKAPFGSHRDLHQNIGLGFLGLRAFHNVMNEPRFEGLPMVLETPIDHKDESTGKDVEDKGVWAREIKMLEGLIGMDAEGEAFGVLEKELADKGEEERRKLQEQADRKVKKERKKGEKGQRKLEFGGTKRGKKKEESERGSESEA